MAKTYIFILTFATVKQQVKHLSKEDYRSIKDKQHFGKKTTSRQKAFARRVIDYCIDHDIGTLVVGYNETFQKDSNIGRRNNQTFVNIPFGLLRDKLEYLCELNGIILVMQEESYTSKASFWDKDVIPVYKSDDTEEYHFSGKRIHRGQYRTASGQVLNADVNGALNIMRKSSVVDVNILYSRGEVDTPIRIRIA